VSQRAPHMVEVGNRLSLAASQLELAARRLDHGEVTMGEAKKCRQLAELCYVAARDERHEAKAP